MKKIVAIIMCCSFAAAVESKPKQIRKAKMELTSDFNQGEALAEIHSWKGGNIAPKLHWAKPPKGTQSFAIIADDPDAPGKTWVHWVVFNIPASMTGITESLGRTKTSPDGIRQGINDFKKIGYDGPYPPEGEKHRYFFKLYALDAKLNLPAGSTKAKLEAALKDHTLATAELMGTYKR